MDEVTFLGYTQVTCLGCRRAVPYACAGIEDSKVVMNGEGVEGVSAKAALAVSGKAALAAVHCAKGTRNQDEGDQGDQGDDEHSQQRARETQLQNACAGSERQGGTARKGPEGAYAQCPECRTELPLTQEELRLSRMLTPQPSSEELEDTHEEVRPLGETHVAAGGGGGGAGGGGGGGGGGGETGTGAGEGGAVGTDAQTSQQAAQGQSGAGGAAGGVKGEGWGGAEAAGDLVAGRGVIDRLSMEVDRSFQIREQFFPLHLVVCVRWLCVCACAPAHLYRADTHTETLARARSLSHYMDVCI